jgi:hypothetical protein
MNNYIIKKNDVYPYKIYNNICGKFASIYGYSGYYIDKDMGQHTMIYDKFIMDVMYDKYYIGHIPRIDIIPHNKYSVGQIYECNSLLFHDCDSEYLYVGKNIFSFDIDYDENIIKMIIFNGRDYIITDKHIYSIWSKRRIRRDILLHKMKEHVEMMDIIGDNALFDNLIIIEDIENKKELLFGHKFKNIVYY